MTSRSGRSVSGPVGVKRLMKARTALKEALLNRSRDRRREGRVPAADPRYEVIGQGQLINISDSGLAVRVANRCTFARGEHCRLTFTEGSATYEVHGKVCWTWSTWAHSPTPKDYYQLAGFSLADHKTLAAREDWRFLRTMARDHGLDLSLSETQIVDPGC